MIKGLVLLFGVMIFLVEISHSQTRMMGFVYKDTTTFEGVKKCQVILYKNGRKILKAKTNKAGFYKFKNLVDLEDVTIKFQKKDYSPFTIIHLYSKRKEFSVDILLRKSYTVYDDLYEGKSALIRMTQIDRSLIR